MTQGMTAEGRRAELRPNSKAAIECSLELEMSGKGSRAAGMPDKLVVHPTCWNHIPAVSALLDDLMT